MVNLWYERSNQTELIPHKQHGLVLSYPVAHFTKNIDILLDLKELLHGAYKRDPERRSASYTFWV